MMMVQMAVVVLGGLGGDSAEQSGSVDESHIEALSLQCCLRKGVKCATAQMEASPPKEEKGRIRGGTKDYGQDPDK